MGKKPSLHFITTIGKRFNRLTVIGLPIQLPGERIKVLCRCDCDKELYVNCLNLVHKNTKSCSCLMIDKLKQNVTKHGLSKSHAYNTWVGMKQRCYNKNNPSYPDYGQRGIIVCDEWINSFETFILDMGKKPSINHSIERVNNNLGYSKNNCIWATRKVQNSNKRSSLYFTYNGKTQTLNDWSEETEIKVDTLWMRIKRGWTLEKTLTTNLRIRTIATSIATKEPFSAITKIQLIDLMG